MRFESLDDWLAWQETLNPKGIDLGLDRVRAVLERLGLLSGKSQPPPFRVITVAGTNGKGSCAACCDAMLRAAGQKTGRYLSPHVSRYNERIAIDGNDIADQPLCEIFEQVDAARSDIQLTYFEFGTIAALQAFRNAEVDVAILEVGLGGRLDAVNAIDADVGVVVSVGLDHVDWLGSDIDQIAREKAGIYRAGKPAIFGRGPVPAGLADFAVEQGIDLMVGGKHYQHELMTGGTNDEWCWRSDAGNLGRRIEHIPLPALAGAHQLDNAAAAIAAVVALQPDIPDAAVREGIVAARIPGRLERVSTEPEILLDVGHNPAAAKIIADYLRERPRRTICLLAMLADKDAPEYVHAMHAEVDSWLLAGLAGPRGRSAGDLKQALLDAGLELEAATYATVADALASVRGRLAPEDRLLIAGSFHTVGEAVASGVYSWQHE